MAIDSSDSNAFHYLVCPSLEQDQIQTFIIFLPTLFERCLFILAIVLGLFTLALVVVVAFHLAGIRLNVIIIIERLTVLWLVLNWKFDARAALIW